MKQILMKNLVLLRRCIYISLYTFDIITKRTPKIVVLCYHSISDDTWRFGVSISDFKQQINFLKKKYSFISLDDLHEFLEGKKEIIRSSIILTFDDGYRDILKVKTFLKKKKITPILFILSDTKHPNRFELDNDKNFLSDLDVRALHKSGWLIGSHSATHSNLATLSQKNIQKEVVESKKELERRLGFGISYFAYPRGKYNRKVLSAVKKAGYKMALTMDDGNITKKSDPIIIPRVGVDRTHAFVEFKSIYSPSVIKFRQYIKKYIGGIL